MALAVEQRRVAAVARLERLDVVGHLSLQVLGGVGALDQELAAAGAVDQAAALAQLAVLRIQLYLCLGGGHRVRFYEGREGGIFRSA